MKIASYLTVLFLSIVTLSSAQSKKDTQSDKIKVWGNCGMCKGHIEKAAKEAGATYALWNKDTKILSVKYEPSKTTNRSIQEKVAAAGYDTKDFTGDKDAYEKLDECCKYERKKGN